MAALHTTSTMGARKDPLQGRTEPISVCLGGRCCDALLDDSDAVVASLWALFRCQQPSLTRAVVVGLAVNFVTKHIGTHSYGASSRYANWSSAISHRRKAATLRQNGRTDA